MQVVIDTNVFVNGMLFMESEDHCDADRLQASKELGQALAAARLVTCSRIIRLVKDDPEDDKFITCAYFGDADYIVSADRHLLDLGVELKSRSDKTYRVIHPRDFGVLVLRRQLAEGKR